MLLICGLVKAGDNKKVEACEDWKPPGDSGPGLKAPGEGMGLLAPPKASSVFALACSTVSAVDMCLFGVLGRGELVGEDAATVIADDAGTATSSPEDRLRIQRYAALARVARECNRRAVVTAHTRDDQGRKEVTALAEHTWRCAASHYACR